MPYPPIWISWPLKQVSRLGNCRIFNKFSLSKRRAKPLKREVHLLEKKISGMCRHVISFFKVRKGHIWVIPHHHTIMGTKEEVQGRWGRSMEVGGGDLGGGWVRGELAPFVFHFPQPLAFFGFSPLNFLIRAKMRKSKKVTKGWIHDPILTLPLWGH